MRIKASEEGARVVAAARSTESRPARVEKPVEEAPPIESQPSVAVAELRVPEASAAEAPAPGGKPPPPHIARGGKPAPPRRSSAPSSAPSPSTSGPSISASGESPAPAPATAKIKVAEIATPAPSEPAPPTQAPTIHTDAGRHSALTSAIGIVLIVFLAELGAGIASNSLALFSDAGHVFMDLFSYGIAFAAVTVSQRRSSERETFGGHRAEIVAAFISGVMLLIVVTVIYLEAIGRILQPEEGNLTFMLTVPLLSIAANFYLARKFEGAHDLNMRGARMHILSDLLSAVGVLVGGVLILATGRWIFDPLVSFFIGFLILRGALDLLRDSAEILLERTPAHLKVGDLVAHISEVPGVTGVHAVHAWSLCSTVHALSVHIVSADTTAAEAEKLVTAVREKVEHDFGIQYTTIQLERASCGADTHPTVVHTASEALAHAHSHA